MLVGRTASFDGRRGVCTAVAKMGSAPGTDVPTATIAIDGTDHSAPVLSLTWPAPGELGTMWLDALRTFTSELQARSAPAS